ncbi:MAG TPA: hypothetical protein VLS49_14280 [Usitatibacter sp.]|nr:hypothetical protein [Usitatibacter sp.]
MRKIAAALLALFLPACAQLGSAGPGLAPQASATRASEALGTYLDELRAMDEARLAEEAARQRRLAGHDASDLERVRAALALSLVPHADEAEILALVEPVARNGNVSSDVRGMASFLQAMAGERRRLRESAATAGNKLRDERRAHEQEKQRAEALQQRAAELQQKLDALSELEKSLSNRPPTSR